MSCPVITPAISAECENTYHSQPIYKFICRTEEEKTMAEEHIKQRGLPPGSYEIEVDPTLCEILEDANRPIVPELYREPPVRMKDITGWSKQQDREAFKFRKEQNKWRNRYFNNRQK